MHKKNNQGFTIVEVIITVVIIGLLASIGGFSYSRINASTRDNERASKIQAIAVALEKYYEENGEYPSCNEMSQPADAITSSVLVGASRDVFTTPTDTSGDSSFISLCGDLTSDIDAFAYIGDESSACLNATDDSAACVEYTLKYKEESTGSIIAIESRHKIVDIALPTSSPILSVALNSTNVVATVTPVTCTEGTPQYSFNSRTNDGSWLGWTNWSDVTLTASQVANQGVKYGYQARSRCYINILKLSDSITTAESTYIHPISTCTTPVVTANTVGNTTTWSWPAVTCPAGTTVQYQYQYTTTYGYNSGWVGPQTALSIAFTTASEGFSYTVNVQSRGSTAFTSGSWSASGSATYARPVTQGLGISVALNGANVQATISPAYTCTTGTAEYAFRSRIDDGTWGAYSAWASTSTSAQAANDGYKYSYQAQARCNASGNYSDIATSSENTYTDPIPTRTMSAVTNSTPAGSTTWSWTAVTCPAGSTTQYQWRLNAGSWSAAQTGLSTTAVGTSTAGTYTVDVQARCFHDAVVDVYSSWSASSSSSYVRPTYTLAISAGAGGTVNTAVNGSYNYGTSVTITATPSAGYRFGAWSGVCAGTASHSISMTANITCSASFVKTWVLTLSAGTGGTVSGAGTYDTGSTPTMTATASGGYGFSSWTGSTGCSGVASHTITMDADKSCTANFVVTNFTLTVNAGTGGTATGGGSYAPGSVRAISATPSAGYRWSSWTASGGTCPATASGNVTVNANMTCTANFIKTWVLTVTTTTGGTVSGGGTYDTGSVRTITATPSSGFTFGSWTGSTGCAGVASHTITMDADKTCTANYNINTPAAPVVSLVHTAATTTASWSWGITSCPAGTAARYQYRYTILPSGYDSGWTGPQDTRTAGPFTTATDGQTYLVVAQSQCYVGANTSSWSATSAGSAAYYRPLWKQISSSGDYFNCAVDTQGKAYCWGSNNSTYGSLGNNSTLPSLIPVPVDTSGVLSGKTVLSISIGVDFACAIASDNNAYCWGNNSPTRLGDNSALSYSRVPVAVYTGGALSGKTIKSISVGMTHACVIASDDNAYCWGDNYYGNLGDNTTTSSNVPVQVVRTGALSGKTIKAIDAGSYHTCAIASDNLAYCWGFNSLYGDLGNNSSVNSSVPVAVYTAGALSGKTILAISAGLTANCVIASDNLPYCWGGNSAGQVGDNTTTLRRAPVAVNRAGVLSGKTIKSIRAGSGQTCAVASDNLPYCWGNNGAGQLGNGTGVDSLVPVAVSTAGVLSGKTVKQISDGNNDTCVVASDDKAYCWGVGSAGQLGNNGSTNQLSPVSVVIP